MVRRAICVAAALAALGLVAGRAAAQSPEAEMLKRELDKARAEILMHQAEMLDLRALVEQMRAQVAALRAESAHLRDENAKLRAMLDEVQARDAARSTGSTSSMAQAKREAELRAMIERLHAQVRAVQAQAAQPSLGPEERAKLEAMQKALQAQLDRALKELQAAAGTGRTGEAVGGAAADSSPPTVTTVVDGDVVLSIAACRLEKVRLVDTAGTEAGTSDAPLLVIAYTVKNASPTTAVTFTPPAAGAVESAAPMLADDRGAAIRAARFDASRRPSGQLAAPKGLKPGEGLTDVLVFEPPSGKGKALTLSFSRACWGGEGRVALKFAHPGGE